MSRRSATRHRKRKARRRAIRDGAPRPQRVRYPLRPDEHEDVHGPVRWRDPRTRWLGLCARGGTRLSFHPTGLRLAVDLDQPDAPERFAEAVVQTLAQAPTVD